MNQWTVGIKISSGHVSTHDSSPIFKTKEEADAHVDQRHAERTFMQFVAIPYWPAEDGQIELLNNAERLAP